LSDCFLPAGSPDATVPIFAVTRETLADRLATFSDTAKSFVAASGFEAAAGQHTLVPGEAGIAAVLFGVAADPLPLAAGKLASSLAPGAYHLADGFPDLAVATLAWGFGAYAFKRYKSSPKETRARLKIDASLDAAAIRREVEAVSLARDLVNTPANDLGPAELADAIRTAVAPYGAIVAEIIGDDLLAQNFPLIHAVGAGSDRPPRLIDVSWGDPSHPKVALVGKGVVFDTGGLDIKPDTGMLLMKKDMGGAANTLALAVMIMGAGLPVRLRLLIPAVENAISGRAFRPGDVFPSRKGLTVEIGNTDAEGRLVLADALDLADGEAPDLLVDMATLTGAARVALGPDIPPFYTRDDAFAADLQAVAMAVADPLWRLPLWKPYESGLDSKIADTNNVASGGFAGSITAALFLAKFVAKAKTWVHLDIYAWTPAEKPGKPQGGEAQACRALFRVIQKRYG
jgi:leucyl aminopeptidase